MIPVCRPYLTGHEEAYVIEALRTGWISSAGKYLTEFEKKFSSWVDTRHGVACANGTAAVHLTVLAAGVGPGDRVVVPSFTMMASVFPIVQQGATPIFVDCDPETWTLDPAQLEDIKGPVKAIMPVHIYGHPCDMDPIREWAKRRGAVVIEDAAESHGALYKGKPCGSLSDLACFSFFANKNLTCGEGGMVVTDDDHYAERARYYRNLCFDKDPTKRFIHKEAGYNYRMTNIQAAIGLAQTEHADKLVDMRRSMAQKYLQRLKGLEDLIQLPVEKPWAKNCYWMFGIVLNPKLGINASEMQNRLTESGIDNRRFFCPGHMQPVFKEISAGVKAPVSEKLWDYGIYLPSSSDLTDDEADQVVSALNKALRL